MGRVLPAKGAMSQGRELVGQAGAPRADGLGSGCHLCGPAGLERHAAAEGREDQVGNEAREAGSTRERQAGHAICSEEGSRQGRELRARSAWTVLLYTPGKWRSRTKGCR